MAGVTDNTEVWYSSRGHHCPPEGHLFAIVNPRTAAEVHLVEVTGPSPGGLRVTLCNRRVLPSELVGRAQGQVCGKCVHAHPDLMPLLWEPIGG